MQYHAAFSEAEIYSFAYLQLLIVKQLQLDYFTNSSPQILKILGIGTYDFH